MTFASLGPAAVASLTVLGIVGSIVLAQQAEPAISPRRPVAGVPVRDTPPMPEAEAVAVPPSREEREAMNAAIRAKLAERRDFDYPEGISLENLLKWLQDSTASPDRSKIKIYVNPFSLSITDQYMTSIVVLSAKDVTVGEYLRDYLARLGLGYYVDFGFLKIDTRAAVVDHRVDAVEEKLDRLTRLIEERLPAVGDFDGPLPRPLEKR